MTFSSDWLGLREPYDHQARDAALVGRLRRWSEDRPGDGPLRILDLGCGTGSTMAALAGAIGRPQRWILVDHDPDLLRAAGRRAAEIGLAAETVGADLARDLAALPWEAADLVTGSALIDLVSAAWLAELVGQCATRRLPCYFALNYDGRVAWTPEDADDALLVAGMHADQTSDKGFGPALGPDCTARAAALFGAAGYETATGDSTWRFGGADRPVQAYLIEDWLGAALRRMPAAADRLHAWADRRRVLADSGRSTLTVGHSDILALPVEAQG